MNPDDTSIHTVASLLKLFLRSLPEPVISYEFYDKFATATSRKLLFVCFLFLFSHKID